MKQMKKLIIVESPAKSKTIQKYVGEEYVVLASRGHIRDLSTTGKGNLGVDVNNNFEPKYEISPERTPIIKELVKAAKASDDVILATDPDREGEAIAWHLSQVLNLDPKTTKRLEFHEITRESITTALENPKTIDMNLVESQETRRILDRIIGFELSNLVKTKVLSPSAGRVQSATLKMLIDHEREIKAFVPQEKWILKVELNGYEKDFIVNFDKYNNQEYKLSKEADGQFIIEKIGDHLKVSDLKVKTRKKEPSLPFITSTLQQDAFSRLGFSSKRTQATAQKLYEGIAIGDDLVGLITYIRTDSSKLASSFIAKANAYIKENYGDNYLGKNKTGESKKKNALSQEAHEAIRPTSIKRTPISVKAYLDNDQYRLYKLIYERTLAYLMAASLEEVTTAIFANNGATFKIEGVRVLFDGYTKVYREVKTDEEAEEDKKILPPLKIGEEYKIKNISHEQTFTKPPARYSEGHLVALMEKEGIGRPSTYAATIENLKDHKYITALKGILTPNVSGFLTTNLLEDYFPSIVDAKYTANLEKQLDAIEDGVGSRSGLLNEFYPRFHQRVLKAYEKIDPKKYLLTDEICPLCGGHLIYRAANGSLFLGCSNYPVCKYVKREKKEVVLLEKDCPLCGAKLVERFNKKGQKFIGCSRYPDCTYTENSEKTRRPRSFYKAKK